MTASRSLLRVSALVLAGVFGAGTLAACGAEVDDAAQVTIGGERFEKIRFADLPRPTGAESKVVEAKDLVETETLEVTGVEPQAVLVYYTEILETEGWEVGEKAQANRDGSWIGTWNLAGRTLIVRSALKTAADGTTSTEFSLNFKRPVKNDQITGIHNKKKSGITGPAH